MKSTFKNSIVGGLTIFGLVSLISSSVSPAPVNGSHGTHDSHVWTTAVIFAESAAFLNMKTGEIRFANEKGYRTLNKLEE